MDERRREIHEKIMEGSRQNYGEAKIREAMATETISKCTNSGKVEIFPPNIILQKLGVHRLEQEIQEEQQTSVEAQTFSTKEATK